MALRTRAPRVAVLAAGGAITGTLTATEAGDTLSAAALLAAFGTLAATEADDTVSAAAQLRAFGTLTAAEADDTLSASARIGLVGTLAGTEANDNLSAAAQLRASATLTATEAADTASGAAQLRITATLSASEAGDALSAEASVGDVGGEAITATLAATEADDTLSAAAGLRIAATLTAAEGADTLSAAGTLRATAALTATEAADTLSAAAQLRIAASLAATEAGDTLVSSAGVNAGVITATFAATDADDIVHAIALVGDEPMSIREAALGAIAAKLTADLGIPVERARRSPINADEALPRVVLTMGGHEEQEGDEYQTILMRCEAQVEGYCSADTDEALDAAINLLHARCARALLGQEIPYADAASCIWIEGRGMQPDAALLDISADTIGGFTWTIGFEVRASYAAGPFVAAAA